MLFAGKLGCSNEASAPIPVPPVVYIVSIFSDVVLTRTNAIPSISLLDPPFHEIDMVNGFPGFPSIIKNLLSISSISITSDFTAFATEPARSFNRKLSFASVKLAVSKSTLALSSCCLSAADIIPAKESVAPGISTFRPVDEASVI